MKKFTIGAELYTHELCECLNRASNELEEQGVVLRGEQTSRGKYMFYTYRLVPGDAVETDEAERQAVHALAAGVAEFITGVWERRELEKIVANDFYYYAADEVEHLAGLSVQMLSEVRDEEGGPLRFNHIVQQVSEQLLDGREMVVEGFLRFRLQAMHEDLHRVVEQAIDEYLMDLEYQEFVKLLRYFLAAQETSMPVLHVIGSSDGEIRLYDAEGQMLGLEELLSAREVGTAEGVVNVEDMMSVLISLAPERLYLHGYAEGASVPSMIETVKKVFQERAIVCSGCPLCEAVPAPVVNQTFSPKN